MQLSPKRTPCSLGHCWGQLSQKPCSCPPHSSHSLCFLSDASCPVLPSNPAVTPFSSCPFSPLHCTGPLFFSPELSSCSFKFAFRIPISGLLGFAGKNDATINTYVAANLSQILKLPGIPMSPCPACPLFIMLCFVCLRWGITVYP